MHKPQTHQNHFRYFPPHLIYIPDLKSSDHYYFVRSLQGSWALKLTSTRKKSAFLAGNDSSLIRKDSEDVLD